MYLMGFVKEIIRNMAQHMYYFIYKVSLILLWDLEGKISEIYK